MGMFDELKALAFWRFNNLGIKPIAEIAGNGCGDICKRHRLRLAFEETAVEGCGDEPGVKSYYIFVDGESILCWTLVDMDFDKGSSRLPVNLLSVFDW